MQADLYDEDASGASWETVPVPEEYLEEAQTRREEMIEALADVNEDIQIEHPKQLPHRQEHVMNVLLRQ